MSTVSKRIKEKHLKLKFILQMLLDLSRKMGLNINPALLQEVTLRKVMKILSKIYRQVYSKLNQLYHHCTCKARKWNPVGKLLNCKFFEKFDL